MLYLLVQGIGWVLLLLAFAGSAYAIACAVTVQRYRHPPAPASQSVPVTLLKPLYRDEPQLAENLETLCRQDYAGTVQIVFGVQRSDSAFPTAENVKASHPELDIVIVSPSARYGSNPKISNLMNMFPAAKHDLLVISDSDIGVPQDYLAHVTAAAAGPAAGVVTC